MNVSFDDECNRYYLNKKPNYDRVGFFSSHENRDVRVGDIRSINNRLWKVVYVMNMFPGWFSSQPKYVIEWRPVDDLSYEKFIEEVIGGIKKAYA
jgi:hypothetical protein